MLSLKVFDKYVEIDQSYGQIIQDHQILKILYYLSMIVANGLMVCTKYAAVCIFDPFLSFSGIWLLSFQKYSIS